MGEVDRAGSNAHSCEGDWEAFYYREILAYWFGSGCSNGASSGHVTFFVNDPFTIGSYEYDKDIGDIRDVTLTAAGCTGSGTVGLAGGRPNNAAWAAASRRSRGGRA